MNATFHCACGLAALLPVLIAVACCGGAPRGDKAAAPRTVAVAQSGQADVLGSDSKALQQAADMLKPGDTLSIGPGTYLMENALYIRVSDVVVRGAAGGKTILFKGPGVKSLLVDDAGYGISDLAVAEPEKFKVGMGVSVLDNNNQDGWAVSVTTVAAIDGDTLRIDPMTLRDYDIETGEGWVQNTFPILAGIDVSGVTFEDIVVDGNRGENFYMNGCRGGAIYLYLAKDCLIKNCVARNFNGDGISFQITERVKVLGCETYGMSGLGLHPGTGSPYAEIRDCHTHDNDQDGLFLCWRVKHGVFADNLIENNHRHGISVGHKDSDNLFTGNTVRGNRVHGVYFRSETYKNSGHRCVFRGNTVMDNGSAGEGCGFYLEPFAEGIVIENNKIADTRSGAERTQRYGVYRARGAGKVALTGNEIQGNIEGDYLDENK
ncbi:MAG: right-handed parallel beta-helix repeat-containing protein [Candidatus Glassbacteria bacterium]|nr:right-handed parallel beta-helix repeat-containing protein [Candidatus Glassbacteria bacterium]